MRLIAIVLTTYVFVSLAQGKRCPRWDDFKCFWDDECIPRSMVCDGKHDCLNGEDETEWFAGCRNCSETGQFHCHKSQEDMECVDKTYLCDGFKDCVNGEDESYEFANCKKSCKRDLAAAILEKRPNCKRSCQNNRQCRPKGCKKGKPCDVKKCLCDYSCGMSCVTITKTCPPLPTFDHLKSIIYIERDRKTGKIKVAQPPFQYDVRAHHICDPGYEALPSEVRYCHGRTQKRWTREVICAKICPAKNTQKIQEDKLSCGMECQVNGDCSAGRICTCDGPCGRTCVNLDVECGDAPPVANGYIEYTGDKFDRVAHYICEEGFYAEGGELSRKCTGSGIYDGTPVTCKPVTCPDPTHSIEQTGGQVNTTGKLLQDGTLPFNITLNFLCKSGQRLLGSSSRTCMSNGQWSGILTICDNIGTVERCPHPGVPIGGELVGSPGDSSFVVDKWVRFTCKEGLVLDGESEQQCLYIKQWSGDGAPRCIDPRYSDSQTEVIDKLRNNVANIRQVRFSPAGRTIRMNSRGKVEVYFVIDLSFSVKEYPLRNTIDFAIGLVKRLSANDTGDRVSYGIVVFATTARVKLNILDVVKKTPKQVIETLNEIASDVEKLRKKINYGTNIHQALLLVNERMIAFSYQNDPQLLIKRHILVLTDGLHNAGRRPSEARLDIEAAYADNPPEFYSITSSARSSDPATQEELKLIASKSENYVYVDDFYKLHTYIDKVTDVREGNFSDRQTLALVANLLIKLHPQPQIQLKILCNFGMNFPFITIVMQVKWWFIDSMDNGNIAFDFGACGQAGDVGSVRKMVTLGRVIGGTSAAERAWPWQSLITRTHDRVLRAFNSVMGGGSLINNRWVLSAAHVFERDVGAPGWEQGFLISLGIIKRPQRGNQLLGSTKVFMVSKIIIHEQYITYEGKLMPDTYQNDIALIRLGAELTISDDGMYLLPPTAPATGVDFTPYIRPVCLPCSPDSCVSKILQKPDSEGNVLIKGGETDEEKCQIEYDFLMGKNRKGIAAVVATGFGHNATLNPGEDNITPTHTLQQAVLKIQDRQKCANEADVITRQLGRPNFKHIFTKQMFCAIGSAKGKIIDTCKGDSGGPITREVRDDTTKKSCFVQLGIVSWGYGCGKSLLNPITNKRTYFPGYYCDVTALMPWIRSTMATNADLP